MELTIFERILIFALPLISLGPFIARNIIVKRRIKKAVKARNPLLTATIVFSTCSFLVIMLSAFSARLYALMGPLSLPGERLFFYGGFLLFLAGVASGWFVSGQLRDSWRVGVSGDQETELVTDGIYARVRNPYVLTVYAVYTGLLLMRPSLVLIGSVLATATTIHLLVLKEERHLLGLHGGAYESYTKATGRYLPRF